MKKSFLFLIVAAVFAGCKVGANGELIGAYRAEEWEQINPTE